VPKQYSTGGKAKLAGISKRGNLYLRKILIHGARAVVLRSKRERIAMGAWLTALEARAPRNVLFTSTQSGPGERTSRRRDFRWNARAQLLRSFTVSFCGR